MVFYDPVKEVLGCSSVVEHLHNMYKALDSKSILYFPSSCQNLQEIELDQKYIQ